MRSVIRSAWQGVLLAFTLSLLAAPVEVTAQETDGASVTLDRIYDSADFRGDFFGQTRWLEDGTFYTTLEPSEAATGGRDIVRYETESAVRTILVSASFLFPEGAQEPLAIHGYEWSPDGARLLVYTNSKRVWRQNTRGDYWVLDLENFEDPDQRHVRLGIRGRVLRAGRLSLESGRRIHRLLAARC
jgi:hypothetical protein